MSHANKLNHLAYSKRAHSEWSLLQKWEADVEKLSIQERKELLAQLKVGQHANLTQCSAYPAPALLNICLIACSLHATSLQTACKHYQALRPSSITSGHQYVLIVQPGTVGK